MVKGLKKSDFVEVFIKYDNGFNDIRLKFYILDILRIMEVLKTSKNEYYYNELRWFVNEISKVNKNFGVYDCDRKLPRIKLKEKKPWELEAMSRGAQ